MSSGLLETLSQELTKLFQPIQDVVDNPLLLDRLLAEIGAEADTAGGDSLANALAAIANLRNQIDQVASQPQPSFAGIASVLEAAGKTFTAIRALNNTGGPAETLENFGRDLIEFLVAAYLCGWHPVAHEIAALLTLVEPAEMQDLVPAVTNGDQIVRLPFRIDRFHLDRLSSLLRDPAGTLRAAYVNDLLTVAEANAMADKLFPRFLGILRELGVSCRYGFKPGDEPLLGDAAALVDHALIVYAADQHAGASAEAGVVLTLSSADRGDLGLLASPFGALQLKNQAGPWAIELDVTAEVQGVAYGRHGVTLVASASTVEIDGSFSATLTPPSTGPAFILGSQDGSRLEVGGAKLSIQTTLTEAKQSLALSADVSKSTIVIASGDGDGFLRTILPADGLRADFDLGLSWSNDRGLTFRGSASLDAVLPLNISIGGVLKVPSVYLGLHATAAAIQGEVSASVALSIGPVQALVDRIGMNAILAFPEHGGNLGVVDGTLAFKLPSGVGLAVDAAGVSGGGFLAHDDSKHEYSGVLQLQFNNLALQAFGLITTQVAGQSGYSLLALIDADFPPVQLGWGFTLDGVGGLLAVNRCASTDALHAALKANTLSSILFPKNAITNAAQILSTLDAIFPTASGRFLFGPMALIGWGTPTVFTAAIAVVIELPEPILIILIARLSVRMPSESQALVRVNLDALGVLDLSQDSLSLDAKLFDSKLLEFTLSGDMALRANWSSTAQREFLLAIGGFHPQFTPPAGFPALQRITIDMPSGPVSKLRLAAYLALTSNTVQFGATLDVFIGVSGFGLAGHLGFDALLQIDPFHFDADISGRVALTAGSDNLLAVSLDAALSGPAPWHIAGDFKVHIVFFDAGVSFSHTWGQDAPAPQIAPVQVLPLLTAALADVRNWGAALPAGTSSLVSLKDAGSQVVHPLARLEVHESVVPLGLAITRFGSATVAGANSFAIVDYQVNGSAVVHETIQDDFAPAQYFELSQAEKLARPSFEQHDAGVRLTVEKLTSCGAPVSKTISYETYYVDQPGVLRTDPGTPPRPFVLGQLATVLAMGASGRAAIRTAGDRRYTAPGTPVTVAPQSFVITDRSSLTLAGLGAPQGSTYSAAAAMLQSALAQSPARRAALQIVSSHELVGA